jgi:hypothetical protein
MRALSDFFIKSICSALSDDKSILTAGRISCHERPRKGRQNMMTFRTTIPLLLIPLLVLTIVADFVDQDSFVLLNQQIIAPQDDFSPQYDRHHPSPVIHSRLPSAEALSAVSSTCSDCRYSTTRLTPALFFFLRAPPFS